MIVATRELGITGVLNLGYQQNLDPVPVTPHISLCVHVVLQRSDLDGRPILL